ncbi:hypothetical protein BSKO_09440 [Bryopsis sp. KO-2023]|nr:hypothetical protein BSKO_09440 [Bryopsis sp. KO-2023]
MRPLNEEEARLVFEKLYKYVGKNLGSIVDQPDDKYCFRLQKGKVFYVKEVIMKRATNVGREHLVGMGTCIGKMTHSNRFHLTIGALDLLSKHARYKLWLKPSSELNFLYGNHVLKAGLGRITENTPANVGIVIYNMAEVPIGFGITVKSTSDCRNLDPTGIVALHQADCGEYLRSEDKM